MAIYGIIICFLRSSCDATARLCRCLQFLLFLEHHHLDVLQTIPPTKRLMHIMQVFLIGICLLSVITVSALYNCLRFRSLL